MRKSKLGFQRLRSRWVCGIQFKISSKTLWMLRMIFRHRDHRIHLNHSRFNRTCIILSLLFSKPRSKSKRTRLMKMQLMISSVKWAWKKLHPSLSTTLLQAIKVPNHAARINFRTSSSLLKVRASKIPILVLILMTRCSWSNKVWNVSKLKVSLFREDKKIKSSSWTKMETYMTWEVILSPPWVTKKMKEKRTIRTRVKANLNPKVSENELYENKWKIIWK